MRFFRRLLAAALILGAAASTSARATITSTATKTTALCNGVTTTFNFSFVGVSSADIVVTLTSAAGVPTVLTSGTQYTLTLTAPVPNAIWGLGGSVLYPVSGSPCPTGSTLTIARSVPYTQTTPFANQGPFLPQATESAADLLTMQAQQLNTLFSGALVQPSSDSQAFSPLPAAAARANLALCFDATGYVPTACTAPASGTISSAMQPVVSAGSLAAGRTAFGLGSAAVEAIGSYGLADDGAGALRQSFPQTSDATNQSAGAAFHLTQRICTGPITYTLARANTLQNGYGFRVYAVSGTCTVTPNASDNFQGLASGTGIAVPQGTTCFVTTNAASSGLWQADCNVTQSGIAASVGASALTLTVNATALPFRSTTLATGTASWATPAAALNITIPSGATLGTSNGVPFRLWIFVAYNGGTPLLGVATCSAATATTAAVYPCAVWETIQKSGTGITAGATALGTLYTASAVTNDAVRIIGYADYASGLATAGAWASVPTTLQVCGAPFRCKLPGDVVQSVFSQSNSTTTTAAITPTSTSNLVRFSTFLGLSTSGGAGQTTLYKRASTTLESQTTGNSASGTVLSTLGTVILDGPGSVSSLTYSTSSSGGSVSVTQESIVLDEIMGAVDIPANDNGSLSPRLTA